MKIIRILLFILTLSLRIAVHAEPADLELFYSKQLAWTAANMDDVKVIKSFQTSFLALHKDAAKLRQLKGPEGQKILQQGEKLMGVIRLKENLEKCLLSEAAAQSLVRAIGKALDIKALEKETITSAEVCIGLKDEPLKIARFGRDLDKSFKDDAKNKILSRARFQLESTRRYWQEAQNKNALDMAVELTDREREMKERPPQYGTELLLYTKALQERKNKEVVAQADIKNAFFEVQTELKNHENYLNEVSKQDSDEALRNLLITNPAATADFLMENPESLNLICKVLQDYNAKVKNKETLNNVMFWGGLVVGGTLLATGVGAGLGAAVLSGTAAAASLTAIAAGAALAGTVTASGETLYASSKAHDSFMEAQNLRSSAFTEGSTHESFSKADQVKAEAYSELVDAGFSAASIIPFGAGFKVMKTAAQASRLGSFSKVAVEGSKLETEVVKSLAATLKEVSADKEVLAALEKAQKLVDAEEMGTFLGYLSDLPPAETKEILELIKNHPDKVPEALRSSAKTGVCK